ncbi:hypothetical protein V8C34DRAFT_295548 [Trichoderma compactum]
MILESAQRILAPYKITYRKLDWWTAYQTRQRVVTSFLCTSASFWRVMRFTHR